MDFGCIFFIDGIRINTILWYGIDYVILSDSCYANPTYQQDMGETTGSPIVEEVIRCVAKSSMSLNSI